MNKSMDKDDVLFREKDDRRMLSKVPDKSGLRTNKDRRQGGFGNVLEEEDFYAYMMNEKAGQRYNVSYDVTLTYIWHNHKRKMHVQSIDISTTGILLQFADATCEHELDEAMDIQLSFVITPGSMPEGYEMQVKNLAATCARHTVNDEGTLFAGFHFTQSLAQYAGKNEDAICWQ